jgi:hypothetical protein
MQETIKFKKWCQLFLDPKSKTMGNATQSALAVYKTKKYESASSIGYQNFRKLQVTGLGISETEGISIKDWYRIASNKAIKGSYEQTLDFMYRLGILDSSPLMEKKARKSLRG